MPIKNDQFGLLNILAICGEVPDQLHIIYTRPSIAPITAGLNVDLGSFFELAELMAGMS